MRDTFCESSLNPCCGGRCSSTPSQYGNSVQFTVLILVVVEDVLVPFGEYFIALNYYVLILVVVEDVLVLILFSLLR